MSFSWVGWHESHHVETFRDAEHLRRRLRFIEAATHHIPPFYRVFVARKMSILATAFLNDLGHAAFADNPFFAEQTLIAALLTNLHHHVHSNIRCRHPRNMRTRHRANACEWRQVKLGSHQGQLLVRRIDFGQKLQQLDLVRLDQRVVALKAEDE